MYSLSYADYLSNLDDGRQRLGGTFFRTWTAFCIHSTTTNTNSTSTLVEFYWWNKKKMKWLIDDEEWKIIMEEREENSDVKKVQPKPPNWMNMDGDGWKIPPGRWPILIPVNVHSVFTIWFTNTNFMDYYIGHGRRYFDR